MLRQSLPLLLCFVLGCVPPSVGECIGATIGQALGFALGAKLGNGFGDAVGANRDFAGPDRAAISDAGTFVSVLHEGRRLEFTFTTGVSPSGLPRRNSECVATDYALLFDADAGLVAQVSLTLSEATATPVDGGTRIRLSCTNLSHRGADAGTVSLPDRAIDVVAP
jgi:hypothetical protein